MTKQTSKTDEVMERTCIDKLKTLTNHDHIKLTNCGNSAIFLALCIAKKENPKPFILIPDQGGWFSYQKYPKLLHFDIKEIKTNQGLLDLEDLQSKVKSGSALLLSSNAGYLAPQDMKAITEICKKEGCLVIEDVSGSIGMSSYIPELSGICDGQYADIMVGSFGRWKLVDVGHGGFISCRESLLKEQTAPLSLAAHHIDLKILHQKLENLKKRLFFILETADAVKKELQQKGHTIIHPEKKGLNVAVNFKDEEEKNVIIAFCKEKNIEHTICPRYIRVLDQAVSIEIKRLQETALISEQGESNE